jgi:alpha-1,3-rhamnosyl/mannosyltransferase
MNFEDVPLEVILAVDAVRTPITGIGRYAIELAQRLSGHPQVADARFFWFGRWLTVHDLARLTKPLVAADAPASLDLRSRLAGNRLAVRVYQALSKPVYKWRLRHESRALFHSPSYVLPPFPGRTVATIHDLSHALYPQFHPVTRVSYMNRALPETLRRADHLITDAESVRQEVIDHYGWPAERITAIPLGVDADFRPRATAQLVPVLQRYGLQPGAYTLYVGTIEPRKNLLGLLDAYERLPQALRQRWPLVLAGSRGWHSAAIHDRMSKAVSAGWARYLDFVAQADLPFLYAGARLFAYPSFYEGFGLPPLEAMASGVPVITSNVSSLPEVVGAAALLVSPHDVLALSEGLKQGLEDDGWRASAMAVGLQRAAQLNWSACVDTTIVVYQNVLQKA